MKRVFWPAGHGAFYWERFCKRDFGKVVNIVYDCGTLSKGCDLEKLIKKTFQKDEVIHAVFISHFDQDHINKLPILLEYCQVKKIYFPIVTPENQKILTMDLILKNADDFTKAFLKNPYDAVKKHVKGEMPQLIGVYAGENQQNDIVREIQNPNRTNINSGENVAPAILDGENNMSWLFIPYNFESKERYKIVMKELKDKVKEIETADDIAKVWQEGDNEKRKIIKKAFGKGKMANTNSMTLFSGEITKKFKQRKSNWNSPETASGCLYTGDYNAKKKWKELEKKYKEYWENIGCVQIPHHGSKYNFNENFLRMPAKYYVTSERTRGKQEYPAKEVQESFGKEKETLYVADEYKKQLFWVMRKN